jgi:uncharacterized membrane protein
MSGKSDEIAHGRFKLFLILLIVGTVGWGLFAPINFAIVLAFDLAALVFLMSVTAVWRQDTPREMRKNAARDDSGRGMLLAISTIVISVILIALVTIMGRAPPSHVGWLGVGDRDAITRLAVCERGLGIPLCSPVL